MKGKLILIVEDDNDVREALSDILTSVGYIVHVASHGQDALDQLQKIPPPSLVILDAMMPIMDGPTFYKEFRKIAKYQKTPVILFSAIGQKVAIEGLAARIDKPGNVEQILKLVSQHCTA